MVFRLSAGLVRVRVAVWGSEQWALSAAPGPGPLTCVDIGCTKVRTRWGRLWSSDCDRTVRPPPPWPCITPRPRSRCGARRA